MKKTVVLATMLSALLLTSCSNPCEKILSADADAKNCESVDCLIKYGSKIYELKSQCYDFLATADKPTLKSYCEESRFSSSDACKKYQEEEITELIASDRENAILKCEEDYKYEKTNACRELKKEIAAIKEKEAQERLANLEKEVTSLAESDIAKAIIKCEDEDVSFKIDICTNLMKDFDNRFEADATREGTNWKAQTCRKDEYALSTFTINSDGKPFSYIMLDFIVTDNMLREKTYGGETIHENITVTADDLCLKSSGRDVKLINVMFENKYTYKFYKNYSDPGSFKFLKNDQGRIIRMMQEDAPLPDIHTLNGYVISSSYIAMEFAVDDTWNCTETSAKETFAKKTFASSGNNANNGDTPSAAPDANPAGNPDAPDKSIASQLAKRVMNEIRLEEGKSVGQFFSIKKALKPCQKAPDSCEANIKDLVAESLVKFLRGVTATFLMFNDDKFDEQSVLKVISELEQQFDSFEKVKAISANSPVGREIMKASNLSDDIKEQIFYIWYLRQYPYAGEDIWKMQDDPSHTWDEYLKMADKYLPQLVNALD